MKKYLSLLLALCLTLSLAACGGKTDTNADTGDSSQTQDNASTEAPAGEPVELIVFAAASMTETMNQLKEMYEQNNPNVTVTYNFDSSGKLLTQIKEGADCDLFISAAPKQMNAMDGSLIGDAEKNPDGLDLIVTDSRVNLLENKVTLTVPEGNPKGIERFDQLAELLKGGEVLLAIGNSDVPVGVLLGITDQAAVHGVHLLGSGGDKQVTLRALLDLLEQGAGGIEVICNGHVGVVLLVHFLELVHSRCV